MCIESHRSPGSVLSNRDTSPENAFRAPRPASAAVFEVLEHALFVLEVAGTCHARHALTPEQLHREQAERELIGELCVRLPEESLGCHVRQ